MKVYIVLFCSLLMSSGCIYAQPDIRIAMTFEDYCSPFFEGVATVGDHFDKCYYIDRTGNRIGDAPGQLIYANSINKIFETYLDLNTGKYALYRNDNMFITDSADRKISDWYSKIEPCNQYFICGKDAEYDKRYVVGSDGRVICEWDGIYWHTFDNSDYVELSASGNHKVLYNGKIVFEDRYIKLQTLSDKWPLIIGSDRAYNKRTGKIIDLLSKKLHCKPFIDFYVVEDEVSHEAEYYDFSDNRLSLRSVSTSSKGIEVAKGEDGKYILKDKRGVRVNDLMFDDVDIYLWQSDRLAVKRDSLWGYVNSDGSIYINTILKQAGPNILGYSSVKVANEQKSFAVLDLNARLYHTLSDQALDEYYVDVVNDQKLFVFKRNSKYLNPYGFMNMTKGISNIGMKRYPEFVDGVAISAYEIDGEWYRAAITFDGKEIFKTDHLINRVGKNLFVATVGENFNNILFNERGDTLADMTKYKIRLEYSNAYGVIPFRSAGGDIKFNGKEHGYGYLYDIYTQSLESTIAQYGRMDANGDDQDANEFLAQRACMLDYYQILGNKAIESGNYTKAISYFDKAIDLYTICNEARYGKAVANINLGNYEEALDNLDIVKLPGAEYAKAVCYFNLGKYDQAQSHCKKVESDDPCADEALQMRKEILKIRQNNNRSKVSNLDKAAAILGAISNGLQLFSQSMMGTSAPLQNYQPATTSYGVSSVGTSGRHQDCPSCHGTGLNSAKERAAMYDYSTETYSNSPCEVCGDRDSHYHKPCLTCHGRGYVNF